MPKSHGLAQIVFKTVFLFPNTVIPCLAPLSAAISDLGLSIKLCRRNLYCWSGLCVLNEEWFPPKPV